MEKVIHRAEERGEGDFGWLKTRYSFSFAGWYEPTRMGFGALRVINDDRIAPHSGFGTHAHRDMEIVTLVREGALTHKDSMGNVGTISAGEVQVMSAGTGVAHSEYNEGDTPVSLFQIWIQPKALGIAPRYAQRRYAPHHTLGVELLVGPDGTRDVLNINQDAYISRLTLDDQHPITYSLHESNNGVYVFVIEGSLEVAGETLADRDALGVTGVSSLDLSTSTRAEALIFEIPRH